MKKLNIFAAVLLILGVTCFASAQTVDEIINKHVQALGGMDSINALKSLKMTGKFSGGGFEAPVTIYMKRPGMVKMVIEFQGNSMIQAYDGTTAWQTNPFSGKTDAEKMPSEGEKQMKEMADFEGPLVNYKQKGSSAELIGKDDMEGTEVFKIKLTDKDGDVTYYFLDSQSYLLLKDSKKRKVKEKEIEAETIYGNYQKYGGVMMAMSIEFRKKGDQQGQVGTLDSIEVNPAVEDSIFKMPEPKNK